MGHANYSNLCDLWVNLLYAKGTLTIGQAVAAAGKRGEQLQASEGNYDAESGMVGMALVEYAFFLASDEAANRRAGWSDSEDWHGPYIEAVLDAYCWKPKKFRPTPLLKNLLDSCNVFPHSADQGLFNAASDAIRELGLDIWADFVRDLPKIRRIHRLWQDDSQDPSDEWETTDRIPWVFCIGKRKGYRDTPRIANITH